LFHVWLSGSWDAASTTFRLRRRRQKNTSRAAKITTSGIVTPIAIRAWRVKPELPFPGGDVDDGPAVFDAPANGLGRVGSMTRLICGKSLYGGCDASTRLLFRISMDSMLELPVDTEDHVFT
jgi:hypothetical protein